MSLKDVGVGGGIGTLLVIPTGTITPIAFSELDFMQTLDDFLQNPGELEDEEHLHWDDLLTAEDGEEESDCETADPIEDVHA